MPVHLSVYRWIVHVGFITGMIMSGVGRDGQQVEPSTKMPLQPVCIRWGAGHPCMDDLGFPCWTKPAVGKNYMYPEHTLSGLPDANAPA